MYVCMYYGEQGEWTLVGGRRSVKVRYISCVYIFSYACMYVCMYYGEQEEWALNWRSWVCEGKVYFMCSFSYACMYACIIGL